MTVDALSRTAAPPRVQLFRGKPVRRMHVMVKPTGSLCNLNCSYCYYLSKQELLGRPAPWCISDEVLERFIRQYFEGQNHQEVIFSWQGGEPTLLGLDFFKKVVALEKKYCPPHVRCENDLQTNGVLLDEAWCEFLHEENFLVGLSIDGPKYLHDAYRKDKAGRGSFDRAFRTAKLLKRYKVNFAALSCVNYLTAKHPLDVYRFLRDEVKSTRMQFIPIVEPVGFRQVAPQCWDERFMPMLDDPEARPGNPGSIVEDWCVTPEDWGNFLCRVFDEWYRKDLGEIYVNYFDAAVETWMGHVSPLCTQSPMCGKGLALEHDGSVYACDHYVYPEYRAGNIMETPLEAMVFSERQERFGRAKEGLLTTYCRQCKYQFACFGECPKNRFIKTPEGEPGLNYLCSGWKEFFSHIDEPIQKIVRRLGVPVRKEAVTVAAEHWAPGKRVTSVEERVSRRKNKKPYWFSLGTRHSPLDTFLGRTMRIIPLDDDGWRKVFRVEAPWSEIVADYQDVVTRYAQARLPGFRPGKAPQAVVEQRFRKEILADLSALITERFGRKALPESGFETLGSLEASEIDCHTGKPFSAKIRYLPMPEFRLPDLGDIKTEYEGADARDRISRRLLELVQLKVPDEMVRKELELDGLGQSTSDSDAWASATDRIRLMIILKKIARQEGIMVEETDVSKRIAEKAKEFGTTREALQRDLEEGGGIDRLRNMLLAESTLGYLVAINRQ